MVEDIPDFLKIGDAQAWENVPYGMEREILDDAKKIVDIIVSNASQMGTQQLSAGQFVEMAAILGYKAGSPYRRNLLLVYLRAHPAVYEPPETPRVFSFSEATEEA